MGMEELWFQTRMAPVCSFPSKYTHTHTYTRKQKSVDTEVEQEVEVRSCGDWFVGIWDS